MLETFTEERYHNDFKACKNFKERATKLLKTTKNPNVKINLRLFISEISSFIKGYHVKGFYFPITYLDGIHKEFQTLGEKPVEINDFRNILLRYRAFPYFVGEIVRMMRKGIRKKLTSHEISLKGVIDTCKQHATANPEDTPFYEPFKTFTIKLSEKMQQQKRLEAIHSIKRYIQPAFLRLTEFLETEYIPACRKDIAVTSLPKIGQQFYKACLKFHTSTDLTAEEIHEIGLKEVARIQDDMRKIVIELGHDMSLSEFKEKLKNDKDTYYTSAQEVLDTASTIVYDKIYPKLSQLFKSIPKSKLNITKSPTPLYPPAIYLTGTEDGSRPGQLFVNNHDFR